MAEVVLSLEVFSSTDIMHTMVGTCFPNSLISVTLAM